MAIVELDGAYNVRDLGGLHLVNGGLTRNGVLYRSDSLDCISEHDEEILFNRLGIGAVIDLRTSAEVGNADWRDGRIKYSLCPLIAESRLGREPFPSGNPQELARVYLDNVRDGHQAVGEIFRSLHYFLSIEVPCIFCCAAGRDRTGVIAALLLSLVGVDLNDIAKDYVCSN